MKFKVVPVTSLEWHEATFNAFRDGERVESLMVDYDVSLVQTGTSEDSLRQTFVYLKDVERDGCLHQPSGRNSALSKVFVDMPSHRSR